MSKQTYSNVIDRQLDRELSTLRERRDKLLEALQRITQLGGNLPDNRLTTRTGPNDARHRGSGGG